jgi:molybdopterin/thiamine biosynthesis adenylyltransferase
MKMTLQQRQRFLRQIVLPEIGNTGQKKIIGARVLIVGAGGLGSASAIYLAAAGIGTIGIAENDAVEISNLPRQILYSLRDIGRHKAECAAEKLSALNPEVKINLHPRLTNIPRARAILKNYDFIIEATDNYRSKILIARACRSANKPYSYAGVEGFRGQTMTVRPGKTACLLCLYGQGREEKEKRTGPIGFVPGIMGLIQAGEALKYILGIGQLLTNRLLIFDALSTDFRLVPFKRNPACPLCGKRRG